MQDGDPCPQAEQLNATMMEPCIHLKGFDYFQGSEVPYIFGCIIVCFIPIAIGCLAYAVIKVIKLFIAILKWLMYIAFPSFKFSVDPTL